MFVLSLKASLFLYINYSGKDHKTILGSNKNTHLFKAKPMMFVVFYPQW